MTTNSTIRPTGNGLLDVLLQEPHTLANLALATRICHHPSEALSTFEAEHGVLRWCALCGAGSMAPAPGEAEEWMRPTIMHYVTREATVEHAAMCQLLRDLEITIGEATREARDDAFALAEHVRKHAAKLEAICRHMRELVRSPLVSTGARLGAVALSIT